MDGADEMSSQYERELFRQIGLSELPAPVPELNFAKALKRRFRFDFAWPDQMVAAEVDGGRYMVRRNKQGAMVPIGQHMSEADYEKLNLAVLLGWRVLRFSPQMIRTGKALKVLEEVLM